MSQHTGGDRRRCGSDPTRRDRQRRQRRGWIVLTFSAWALMAGAVLAGAGSQRDHLSSYLEPMRSEFGGWLRVAWNAGAGESEAIPEFELGIEPKRFRAAALLGPRVEDERQRWWFPGHFAAAERDYGVEIQLAGASENWKRPFQEQSWRVRFEGKHQFLGAREIELRPARPDDHALEIVARERARALDLLAPPAGFSRLRVNGADAGLYFWSERSSDSMLDRMGYARGEFLRPSQAGIVPDRQSESAEVAATRLDRLSQLALHASDAELARGLSALVNVRKLVTWSALASLLCRADAAKSLVWYFDPVTGLLEPVARGLGAWRSLLESRATSLEGPGRTTSLIARVLEIPEYRAARDRILAALVDDPELALAPAATERLAGLLPSLASVDGLLPRPDHLRNLALLQRQVRSTLRHNAALLRSSIAAAAPLPPAVGTDTERELAQLRANTGLPFTRSADALQLPAGNHHLSRTLVLPSRYRLEIEPGATLLLDPGVSIVSFRGLVAEGTRDQPIRVTGTDPERPWGSIGVVRAPEASRLSFIVVSGGSSANIDGIELSGQLSFNASDVVLSDSEVRGALGSQGMSVKRARFDVHRSRFVANSADGLDAVWSEGRIFASLFADNGDDGLDLGHSQVRVRATTFHGMVDKSISAGERSRVDVVDSRLVDSGIAITAKGGSQVDVVESEFRRNELVLALYRDKAVYSGGRATVTGGLLIGNERDFEVESGSNLQLNGVVREENVASRTLHAVRTPELRPHAVQ